MPTSDLLYWFDSALKNGAAWPGHLLTQAREWDQVVALRLRALTGNLWLLWAGLWRGESNAELVTHLGWSRRTVERHLSELYTSLGAQQRSEVVGVAWAWGLVKAHATGPEWSLIVQELFPLSNATG
jgi:DNA-binding NarL/FixJ family response regulator